MLLIIVLFSLLNCEPSIKTLNNNYAYGDSIGLEIINPCDNVINYCVFLERYDRDVNKWRLVDVDVFTHYLYLGPLRALMSQSSVTIYNLEKDYGEHILKGYYENGGTFRYGISLARADDRSLRELYYSNEFKIVPSE
jgi:hypothetical protein